MHIVIHLNLQHILSVCLKPLGTQMLNTDILLFLIRVIAGLKVYKLEFDPED